MSSTEINGRQYDWDSVEIKLPSGIAVGIEEISYNDEHPVEDHYGKGSTSAGFGRKNYKASGSLTLFMSEAERLRTELGGSYYANEPFNIVVAYANDDQDAITDTLKSVLISKTDTSAKQGESKVGSKKFDIRIGMIEWNGDAAVED